MKLKISFAWSIIIIDIVTALCGWIIILSTNTYVPIPQVDPATTIVVPKEVLAQLLSRLVIPAIHVNAHIEYLGLTSTGAMAVPIGPDDVAWFDLGPRPGDPGAAVIAGHEGWKDNIPAVFDNLHDLKVGDTVEIINGAGATTTFIVEKFETYGQNANSESVFDATDTLDHLNLITCAGAWDVAEQSHLDRLVVFTVKE